MPYDTDFYIEGCANFCFAKLTIGGQQIECVSEEYETERIWVRTGYYPAPSWAQEYTGGQYGSAWDDLGYGTRLEAELKALPALQAAAKQLGYVVVEKETLEAVVSEVKLFRFAYKHHPALPIARVRDCGCMGPMPECKCAKRERLVKAFLAAVMEG